MKHVAQSKMAAPNPANLNTQNQNQTAAWRPAIPSLATLQTDTAVQEELKALQDSLGDPFLLDYLMSSQIQLRDYWNPAPPPEVSDLS